MKRENGHIPKIAFDTWALQSRFKNHGIHTYAKNLLKHFREAGAQSPVEIRPFVCRSAGNEANSIEAGPHFYPIRANLLSHDRLWRLGGACLAAFLQKADLTFCPTVTSIFLKGLMPTVTTIHDLIPVLMPESFQSRIGRTLRFCSKWAAKHSRTVMTVSMDSKNDLVRLYGLPPSKISVVYPGYDKEKYNTSPPDPEIRTKVIKSFSLTRPYILHFGAIKPSKNLKRLIQAYRLALSRNPNLDLDLVLVGEPGWRCEEVLAEASKNAGAKGSVVLTGPLSDSDLVSAIKGATLAVNPSLYEGFCLPMIESMACGIPTVVANISSLQEISGGVLRYFDPQSVEELAACMEAAIESETVRSELSKKGVLRANFFDWKRCSEESLAILAAAASERNS